MHSSDRSQSSIRDTSLAALLGTGLALLAFWIPIAFYAMGVSATPQFEESVGYRYFYSLRNVSGGEFPWLPQGQFPNLTHRAIQRVLNALGFAPTDLGARIDLFSLLAILLPLTLSAILATSIFRSRRSDPGLVLVVFAALLLPFLPPTPNAWTVMPDYHVWLLPLALASVLLTVNASTWPQARTAAAVGALSALAVCTKVSFLVFAVPPAIACLARMVECRRFVRPLGIALAVGVACTAGILVVHYRTGDRFFEAMRNLAAFARSQAGTLPESMTWEEILLREPRLALALLGQVALAGYALWTRRAAAAAMSLGGLALIAFVLGRFYSHSFIELHAYLFMELSVLAHWISLPERIQPRWRAAVLATGAVALGLATKLAWPVLFDSPVALIARCEYLESMATRFDSLLHRASSSVWVLTTGNQYRPNSIHSALCKGGTSMFVPYWGQSPFTTQLFPDYHCATVPGGVAQDDLTLASIGFLRMPDEGMREGIERVEAYFEVDLSGRECTDVPGPDFGYVVCDPEYPSLARAKP